MTWCHDYDGDILGCDKTSTTGRRQIRGVAAQARLWHDSVANPDFSGKVPHFSAKHKIFLQAVKYAERALFARIQLGRSWAR